MKPRNPADKPSDDGPAQAQSAPRKRPDTPSPPERHPGLKPEEAQGEFEDLEIRESGNRR